MRIILALILFFYSFNALASFNSIEYRLSLTEVNHKTALHIDTQAKCDKDGKFETKLPIGAKNTAFYGGANAFVSRDLNTGKISILQNPFESFTLKYDFYYQNPYKDINAPIITKDLILFNNDMLLPLPLHRKQDVWNFLINATAFPDNMLFMTGEKDLHNKNKKKYTYSNLDDFSRNYIIIGNYRIQEFSDNNHIFKIGLDGKWDWLSEPIHFYLSTLMQAQSDFFDNHDEKNYYFFFSENNHLTNYKRVDGRHVQNLLLFSISPNPDNTPSGLLILSHELFHQWLGVNTNIKDLSQGLTWFVEGFTEYYGQRFAFESKMVNFDEYLAYFNKLYEQYYTLPNLHCSQHDIEKYFNMSPSFRTIEMIRGMFLAHELEKIKNREGYPMVDVITKEIYQKLANKKNADAIEQKNIIYNTFEKHLGVVRWSEIKNKLSNGQLSEYETPNELLGQKIKMSEDNLTVSTLNFDINYFLYNKIIKNLSKTSPEYQVGLRNGMFVLDHNISFNKKLDTLTFFIKDGKKVKKIHFHPDSKKIKIPQFSLSLLPNSH